MERAEAEAILDGDRETAVGLLLRLDELVEANQRLVDANERLEARVAELERRLNRSSRNSSLPPSQDPPSAPPRPRGEGAGSTDTRVGTGGCSRPNRSTRSSSIGPTGAGRVRTSSPRRIVSTRPGLPGVRSPSCRRSRSG